MRKSYIAAIVASLVVGTAYAQTGAAVVASEPGKVAVAETQLLTATITAVDKAKRLVTLKGPEGNSVVFQAGPAVKNFDQLKAGDLVVVKYVEALTLELKKGGGQIREKVVREGAVGAKPGETPAGAAGRQVTVVADVIAVDAAKQTIRLKGPERTVDLKVRDPNQFKLVKVGDQVEATFTEAVALAVDPAPAAPAAAPKK
ncbi:MAG TPA: hypothetical protein VMK32_14390 [Burkholderiaceae bacterium]|nr:hypothetical protein [Burkholderiaceae bacterium]